MFDCDGVLVDSEIITTRAFRRLLVEMGWDISEQECADTFIGKAFLDEWRVIYDHTGVRIDHDWIVSWRVRRDAAIEAELQPIPGAPAAVRAVADAMGEAFACVSGADRRKIDMQLRIAGLDGLFAGRVFCGTEMARSKPAPDVYLAAAAALAVDPATMVVVEDSATGVRAGVAAGATVLGFAPIDRTYSSAEALLAAGARGIFTDMADLPGLVLNGSAWA